MSEEVRKPLTACERGEQLVGLLDIVTKRLAKELAAAGEIKSALITNALDLLRFSGLTPQQFISFVPKESQAALVRRLPFPEGVTITPMLDEILSDTDRKAVATPFPDKP